MSSKRLGVAVLACALVMSCSQDTAGEAADAVQPLAVAEEEAPPAPGEERLYGKRAFTIVYDQTGAAAGRFVEHARDFGRRRVERLSLAPVDGVAGPAAETRVLKEGARILAIDDATGIIVEAEDPTYALIVAAVQTGAQGDVGAAKMRALGGVKTGETGGFAGYPCEYWQIPQQVRKVCVTAWGGELHDLTNEGAPAQTERRAMEVRLGDGGPDAAFAYDASRMQSGPRRRRRPMEADPVAPDLAPEPSPKPL